MKKMVFAMAAVMAAVCVMTSCSQESEDMLNGQTVENETQVVLTFSPYEMEAMTRAASSISNYVTKLDVWITESTNTTEVHQVSTDDGFGTVSVTLDKTKTYTLVAVAHRAGGAATLTDGVIAFPDEKVTHAMIYTTSFSPATTTNINAEMTRIVGMFRFEVSDQVPDDAYTMQFVLGSSYTRWNVASAIGTNVQDRTATFNNFSKNNDGTAAFSIYIIPTNLTDTDHMDITVTALYENGDEYESKTFTGVPIKAGYKTTYHGQFFTTTATSAGFTVDDWSEFDVIDY